MHEMCLTCFHKHMSKTIDIMRLNSPCYTCLYNKEMMKTNNYTSTNNGLVKIFDKDGTDVE